MFTAILIFLSLSIVFGLLLGYASIRFKIKNDPIVEHIDKILPQTQCGQCFYPGCKPYAKAVSSGEAEVNQCVPGGEEVMLKISEITGRDPKPMQEENKSVNETLVAYIHEEQCIGCMICIKECPVDAIIGTTKMMHTVLIDDCTGCDKCIPVCPVDCIDLMYEKNSLQKVGWSKPIALKQLL